MLQCCQDDRAKQVATEADSPADTSNAPATVVGTASNDSDSAAIAAADSTAQPFRSRVETNTMGDLLFLLEGDATGAGDDVDAGVGAGGADAVQELDFEARVRDTTSSHYAHRSIMHVLERGH